MCSMIKPCNKEDLVNAYETQLTINNIQVAKDSMIYRLMIKTEEKMEYVLNTI